MAKDQHLRLHAEAQQVVLEVDAALVAAQHVQAEQEVRALLHDGDAHGQVLQAYLGIHLRSRFLHHVPVVCMARDIPYPRESSSLLMMVIFVGRCCKPISAIAQAGEKDGRHTGLATHRVHPAEDGGGSNATSDASKAPVNQAHDGAALGGRL